MRSFLRVFVANLRKGSDRSLRTAFHNPEVVLLQSGDRPAEGFGHSNVYRPLGQPLRVQRRSRGEEKDNPGRNDAGR